MTDLLRLVPGLLLNGVVEYFRHLYETRNSLLTIDHLMVYASHGAGKIHKGLYTNHPGRIKAGVAQTIAGILACNNHFRGGISIAEAMAKKYPLGGCVYCGEMPCDCWHREKGPPARVLAPAPEQLKWNLQRWAEHNNRVYGSGNSKRDENSEGTDAIARLYREMDEVRNRLSGCGSGSNLGDRPSQIISQLRLEITDVIARTLAIANLRGVNPEEALIAVFGNGCPGCHGNPCDCPMVVEVGDELRTFGTVCVR